jgi:hypothetical protein
MTINGRPVFLVYRPSDLPSAHKTMDMFRARSLASGVKEPFQIGINGPW